MRIQIVWRSLAFAALSMLAVTAQAKTDKPNILVIWGDDIGWSNVSAYHRGMLGGSTPNIDRGEIGPRDEGSDRQEVPGVRDRH